MSHKSTENVCKMLVIYWYKSMQNVYIFSVKSAFTKGNGANAMRRNLNKISVKRELNIVQNLSIMYTNKLHSRSNKSTQNVCKINMYFFLMQTLFRGQNIYTTHRTTTYTILTFTLSLLHYLYYLKYTNYLQYKCHNH